MILADYHIGKDRKTNGKPSDSYEKRLENYCKPSDSNGKKKKTLGKPLDSFGERLES